MMNCNECGGNMFKIINDEQLRMWECSLCGNAIVLNNWEEEIAYEKEYGTDTE